MTLDIKRSGYDNLFLVGGYDWYAKLSAVEPVGIEDKAKALAADFDDLDKKDDVLVAKWKNEVLHACGMQEEPLPAAKVEAKSKVKEPEAKEPVKLVPKSTILNLRISSDA